jgi:type III pantothenate kinase
MQQLLIDLGNTRIKWALRSDSGRSSAVIAQEQALEHSDPIWQTQFAAALAALPKPDVIALAAVAPEMIVAAASRMLEECWPDVPLKRAHSRKQLARFQSSYTQPERMGVDRFLAAVAAAQVAETRMVIGCGTALTIDLIDASGQHRGGLIAPAPETMRAAVLSRTARVHWLREGSAVDFGNNTEDALEGGVWMAAAGMVERALRKATVLLGAAPALIAHGGSAPMLAKILDMPLPIEPMLVFQGLAIWVDAESQGA